FHIRVYSYLSKISYLGNYRRTMIVKMINRDIFHLLQQKSRYIKKRMDTGLKSHQLYASQWSILFCLDKLGPMTQTDIRTYLNVEAPTITRTLERLEQNGLIIRKQGIDKRERVITLTKEANASISTIINDVGAMEDELLRHFSDSEKKQLYNLLHKIEPMED